MSYLINNQQKVNDIVFANRNKTYGAYVIRSTYGNTVFKSLAFMMLGFGTIMSVAFYMSNRPSNQSEIPTQVFDNDSTYTISVTLPEKHPEPLKPAQQPPAGGGEAGMSTVISETATIESATTTAVSTGPSTGTTAIEGTPGTGTNTLVSVTNATTEVSSEPVAIPDSAPEYEGGLKALYAFLGSKLKYPEDARDVGKEGTVYVKFVVDQNGRVGNLQLLNNLGYGLDEEALRVVGMIPSFKSPGKVKGMAVKVYYQLPIKFKMQ